MDIWNLANGSTWIGWKIRSVSMVWIEFKLFKRLIKDEEVLEKMG